MFKTIKKQYEKDKPKFIKEAAIGATIGAVTVCSFPYVMAGAGLALGFWVARKAAGQIEG